MHNIAQLSTPKYTTKHDKVQHSTTKQPNYSARFIVQKQELNNLDPPIPA